MFVSFLDRRIVSGDFQNELRVPDLNVACTNRCEKVLFDCIISCGDDSNCISQCIRENGQCYNGKSPLLNHRELGLEHGSPNQ